MFSAQTPQCLRSRVQHSSAHLIWEDVVVEVMSHMKERRPKGHRSSPITKVKTKTRVPEKHSAVSKLNSKKAQRHRIATWGFDPLTNTIPPIVEQTVSFLEQHALQLEGIFRISGAVSDVRKLKQAFEKGKRVKFPRTSDPHNVAGVLKLFLKESRPLFTYELYKAFMAASAIKDQQRFLHCLREATAALPIGCYAIVRRIMAMLSVVSKFSELSKMNPKNIAMIFTPTMLRVRGETVGEVLFGGASRARVIEFMVDHFEFVFDDFYENPESAWRKRDEEFDFGEFAETRDFIKLLHLGVLDLNKTLRSSCEVESGSPDEPAKPRGNTLSASSPATSSTNSTPPNSKSPETSPRRSRSNSPVHHHPTNLSKQQLETKNKRKGMRIEKDWTLDGVDISEEEASFLKSLDVAINRVSDAASATAQSEETVPAVAAVAGASSPDMNDGSLISAASPNIAPAPLHQPSPASPVRFPPCSPLPRTPTRSPPSSPLPPSPAPSSPKGPPPSSLCLTEVDAAASGSSSSSGLSTPALSRCSTNDEPLRFRTNSDSPRPSSQISAVRARADTGPEACSMPSASTDAAASNEELCSEKHIEGTDELAGFCHDSIPLAVYQCGLQGSSSAPASGFGADTPSSGNNSSGPSSPKRPPGVTSPEQSRHRRMSTTYLVAEIREIVYSWVDPEHFSIVTALQPRNDEEEAISVAVKAWMGDDKSKQKEEAISHAVESWLNSGASGKKESKKAKKALTRAMSANASPESARKHKLASSSMQI